MCRITISIGSSPLTYAPPPHTYHTLNPPLHSQVRACVAAFKKLDLPLHCLVNNAGLMMETRNTTEDGLEMVMTANHLAHFLFTCLLVPQLQVSARLSLFLVQD